MTGNETVLEKYTADTQPAAEELLAHTHVRAHTLSCACIYSNVSPFGALAALI